jgi:hypothetical protein
MANTKGIRRTMGAMAAQWNRPWGTCEWPKGCDRPADYKTRLWHGRVVQTCSRHTPKDWRDHPRGEE